MIPNRVRGFTLMSSVKLNQAGSNVKAPFLFYMKPSGKNNKPTRVGPEKGMGPARL